MIRRTFRNYALWLETKADGHIVFASVLRATAHRIRFILDDNPPARTTRELGYSTDGGKTIHPLDPDVEFTPPPGTRYYYRKATAWKERPDE